VSAEPPLSGTAVVGGGGPSVTLLVADDNDVALRLCRRVLEKAGYKVLTASDAQEAMSLALANSLDMILLDHAMPGMDSLEAMRQIKQQRPGIVIVIASVLATASDRERYLVAGADDVLIKPFRLSDLVAVVAKLTANRGPQMKDLTGTRLGSYDGTAARNRAPVRFGLEFIGWLREATESHWRTYVPHDFSAGAVAGLDWQAGTRWRGGMTQAEVAAAESQFGVSFPPDYRLFLRTLHTPDPPLVGAVYEGDKLVRATGRILPDWTGDPTTIDGLLEWAVEALLESSYAKQKYNWMSRADWFAAQRRNLASGPQYIPVIGHSYLVCSGGKSGMPIIRFDESDVVIRDSLSLRECLMGELFVPAFSVPLVH
jgi:CheY-like chemotaxis protein